MGFERHDKKDLISKKLQNESLWKNHLEADCRKGEVFFAIRNDRLDFYHKGGRLFSYTDKGFTTHVKYAAVIEADSKNYLNEAELGTFRLRTDFMSNLVRIKENCENYSGDEAKGVSEIYQRYSYLSSDQIVVLDIEVAFEGNEDRIDILLFDTKNATLRFVEAKHFSNKAIWSKKGRPEVVDQIERYEQRLQTARNNIISEYTKYVHSLNSLFGITLPKPKTVDDKVALLIFGFDVDQKKGRLNDLVIQNQYYKGLQVYRKGDVSGKDGISLEELWNTKVLA